MKLKIRGNYVIRCLRKVIVTQNMGSGTTALASRLLNRHFIGFEIDKGYYDIAINRLKNVPERLDKWIMSY